MTPPDAPASGPRKTLVEMFESPFTGDELAYCRKHDGATVEFLARLREADAAENALDEARICADADGVRIRELVADRDRETVNREAVQHVLADVVAERDALVSLLAVNEAEGETLAGTVRALYEANERGVARYGDVLRERDEARQFAETERNEGHRRFCAQFGHDAERTSKLLFPWEEGLR